MELGALLALEKAAARRPDLVAAMPADWLVAVGRRRCLAGEPGRGRRELAEALLRGPLDRAAWRWLARGAADQLLRRTDS